MTRRWLLGVMAAVIFSAQGGAQESEVPPLEGSEWGLKLQLEENIIEDGKFMFTKVKDDQVEGTFVHPKEGNGTWKGTLKDGLLKGELLCNGVTSEVQIAISYAGGEYLGGGIGRHRLKGEKGDWLQASLKLPSRKMKKARGPSKELVEALSGKEFTLRDGRKDEPTAQGGFIKIEKIEGMSAQVVLGRLKPLALQGVMEGNTLALSIKEKNDLNIIFHKDDGKWKGPALFGGANAPIAAMLTVAPIE